MGAVQAVHQPSSGPSTVAMEETERTSGSRSAKPEIGVFFSALAFAAILLLAHAVLVDVLPQGVEMVGT